MKVVPLSSLIRFSWFAFAALALAYVTPAFGKGSAVAYNPPVQTVEGNMPFAASYTLSVTSPSDLPAGTSTVVGFSVNATTVPVGTAAQAVSYISFSPSTLTFTGPSQTLSVTVTATFPVLQLPAGVTSATFSYQAFTTGWAAGTADPGTSINATASVAPGTPAAPPVVTIATPADGAAFTYAAGALPAQIAFHFDASVSNASSPITNVDASFGGQSVTLTNITGLNTTTVGGDGTLTVSAPGLYSVTARAMNNVGVASDTNNFTVAVSAPPPTVVIDYPADGSSYTYYAGGSPVAVPVHFTATSYYGGIRTLTATVDGQNSPFVPSGIDTLTATGVINLSYTVAGTHTVVVTTTDDNGNATATTHFTVNVVSPQPTLHITSPANGTVITAPIGTVAVDVPFAFTTTSNNGFVVDSVAATLDGIAIAGISTSGLATPVAQSSGTMLGVTPGTHTLTAAGYSAGIKVTDTVQFTVNVLTQPPPPSVVITSPAEGSTYTRYTTDGALSIPLTFTGTSNASDGIISKLTATLDGTPLVVSAALGSKVVGGSAPMSVLDAGTHVIVVTAFDQYGSATASRPFTVTVLQGSTISGTVFFDANANTTYDAVEFGLRSVTVTLKSGTGVVVATKTTAADGSYSFSNVPAGTFTVVAQTPTGLKATAGVSRSVTVPPTAANVNIGFTLDFSSIQGMSAGGYTIGYWKNNIDKSLKGAGGTQVSSSALTKYTTAIGAFALSPYNAITMKQASAIMGSNSSAPLDLLSKQLIASEYNYQNGAYLNGNGTLTYLFVWWGEYVLSHPAQYSDSSIISAKDWFDAYNNTHGGAINGPGPL